MSVTHIPTVVADKALVDDANKDGCCS